MRAKRLIPLAFALLLGACSDGGPTGPGAGAAAFTADEASYPAWGIATVTLNGAAPAAGTSVTGTLGTAPVSLLRASDSTMIFVVPPAAGVQTLEFTIGTRTYRGPITVTARAPVQDPEAFLGSLGDVADAQLAALATRLAGAPLAGDSAQTTAMLAEAQDSLASFRSLLAQMSADERQQLADLLDANLGEAQRAALFAVQAGGPEGALLAIPAQCAQGTALQQYKCTWGVFFVGLKDVAKYLGGAVLAAESSVVTGLVGLGASAVFTTFALVEGVDVVLLGLELLKIHGMLAVEIGVAVVDATADLFRTQVVAPDAFALASSGLAAGSMTRLRNGRPVTFRLAPQLRPVQPADRAVPLSWISGALALLGRYNELVARVDPDYRIGFAAPGGSFPVTVPWQQVGVEVVGNSSVEVQSVSGAGDRITMVFRSDAAGAQDFTYDLVYRSDVYPTVRVRHQATLDPATYLLADTAGVELPDTVFMISRWTYPLQLLQNDGSVIPDSALGVTLAWAGPGYPENHVELHNGAGTQAWMRANLYDAFVDTIDVEVQVDGQRIRDITFIAADSAMMRHVSAVGRWYHYQYDPYGALQYRDEVQLNADGSGQRLSRIDRDGDLVTTITNEVTWAVWLHPQEGSRHPRYELRWVSGGYSYGGPITYPTTEYYLSGSGGSGRGVKQ